LAKLARWKGPSEAFVCATLALEHQVKGDNPRVAQVLGIVASNPQRMLRGLIAALAWSPQSAKWQKYWVKQTAHPTCVVAAWRSRAVLPGVIEPELVDALPAALQSASPEVRASACRVQALVDSAPLALLLKDPVREVRAEAAIGMTVLWHTRTPEQQGAAANALWRACNDLLQELPQLGASIARTRAEHRLARWIRHVALVAMPGFEGIGKLIEQLPPRLGLSFVLHHGDAHYLPWVVKQMNNPDAARLAGWVWSSMTGIDLQSNHLSLPPRGPKDAPRLTDSEDPGVVEPNQTLIQGVERACAFPCVRGRWRV